MTFNEKISSIMDRKGIGSTKLSKKVGVSQGYVSDIKHSRVIGNEENVEKIIKGLEVSPEEEKELWLLWTFAKGRSEVYEDYKKLKEQNDALKKFFNGKQEKLDIIINNLDEIEMFEGLLELPDNLFLEIVKAIRDKMILHNLENNDDSVKIEIEKLDKILSNIK